MDIASLVDLDRLWHVANIHCGSLGVASALVDDRGNRLRESGWQRICTEFHLRSPEAGVHCAESASILSGLLRPGDRLAIHTCRNGLVDAMAPIVVNGEPAGNWFIGQFLFEPPDEAPFVERARRFGFDEKEYLGALSEVPVIPEVQVRALLDSLVGFAELLADMGLSALRQSEMSRRLQGSESLFRTFFELGQVGMAIASPDKGWLHINDRLCEMLGYALHDLEKTTPAALTHPDDLAADVEQFERLLAGEIDRYTLDKRFIRGDGTELLGNLTVGCARKPDGTVDYVIAHVLDIGERERARRELDRERSLLRTLLDALPDQVFVKDREGRFLLANKTVLAGLGRASEPEILGLTDFDLLPEETARRHAAEEREVTEGGIRLVDREHSYRDGEGRTECFLSTKVPLRDPLGDVIGLVGINHPITDLRRAEEEQRRLEAQVHRAQRLESLGVLAGGIAHDFNNILAAVMGFAELARAQVEENSGLARHLDHILQASGRAASLVRQILAATRQATSQMEPVLLAPILKEALRFLRSSTPSTIEIVQYADPTCGTVLADPTQIHQVVMNLCTNAQHAMRDDGGVMEVRLEQVHVCEHEAASFDGLRQGDYARITVSDTGCGMSEAVRERVFEPFFTTKEKSEGTGLGLSVTHGIVAAHGGAVRAYSEPGVGSTFHVYIPIEERESAPEPLSQPSVPRGDERVLLVDDEETLSVMGGQMLTGLGYSVTLHTGSLAALEEFTAAPDAFDILATDQTMPQLTGLVLAERVRAIRPNLPVLLLTGFSRQAEAGAAAGTVSGILAKPYTMRELAEAVRNALDTAMQ